MDDEKSCLRHVTYAETAFFLDDVLMEEVFEGRLGLDEAKTRILEFLFIESNEE